MGFCNRFRSNGEACRNVTFNEDGWCRELDCSGFTRSIPVSRAFKDLDDFEESEATKYAHSFAPIEQIPKHVLEELPESFYIKQKAIDLFIAHHGGNKHLAISDLQQIAADFLNGPSEFSMSEDQIYLALRHEMIILTIALDSMAIINYWTAHRERTWSQIKNNVPSRSSKKKRKRKSGNPIPRLTEQEKADAKLELRNLSVGDSIQGKIVTIVKYGFFIEIQDLKINGLVHISTLNTNLTDTSELDFTVGKEVQVSVQSIDSENLRLSLKFEDMEI